MQRESDRMNTTTKITPSVRQEVLRLLSAVPRGLGSDSLATIARMHRRDVEAALAELEASGDYWRKPVMLREQVAELWARR